MGEEIFDRLEKQYTGVNLGLGALAEVLQKMNTHFEKQEALLTEEEQAKKDLEEEVEEKSAYDNMVKQITDSVTKALLENMQKTSMIAKQTAMDSLNTDKERKVDGTKWPMSANPSEAEKEVTTSALDQNLFERTQVPLVAMEKHMASPEAHLDEEKNTAAEYPMEEDKGEDEALKMVKQLQLRMSELEKENVSLKKGMASEIKKEAEERLRKMGFREETGLAGPKMLKTAQLGLADKQLIQKGDSPKEMIDKLTKLSWGDLNDLKFKLEAGDQDSMKTFTQ